MSLLLVRDIHRIHRYTIKLHCVQNCLANDVIESSRFSNSVTLQLLPIESLIIYKL